MAVLISKVVRSGSRDRHEDAYSSSNNLSRRRTQHACRADTNHHRDSLFTSATRMDTLISGPTLNKHDDQEYQGPGIMKKTVVATVRMNEDEGSTEELVTKPMPPPSG